MRDNILQIELQMLFGPQQLMFSHQLGHDELPGCFCVSLGMLLRHTPLAKITRVRECIECKNHVKLSAGFWNKTGTYKSVSVKGESARRIRLPISTTRSQRRPASA